MAGLELSPRESLEWDSSCEAWRVKDNSVKGQGYEKPLQMGKLLQRGQVSCPASHSMLVAEPESQNPQARYLPRQLGWLPWVCGKHPNHTREGDRTDAASKPNNSLPSTEVKCGLLSSLQSSPLHPL